MSGKLTIVPTPLGNLGDITIRALDALKSANAVCAEDTRVTGKLLAALCIEGKRLERLDENVMGQRADAIIERVIAGETIAYCTDAGMPGVSDPGLRLVRAARDSGAPVEVLPGASAVVTAYVSSGCKSDAFYFGGFLPRKAKARADKLEELKELDAALIFYESPNRLVGALEDIASAFPLRTVTVCRELTKRHEETVRAPSAEILCEFAARHSVKGEITIVIDPPGLADDSPDFDAARIRARDLSQQGQSPKSVARHLTEELGIPRNKAYELALGQASPEQSRPD